MNIISEWPAFSKYDLPPDIASLPCLMAEPWIEIDDDPVRFGLEGPIFDHEGNFYCCQGGPASPVTRVFKVTPDKEKSVWWQSGEMNPTGLAVHKDGRFFAACITGELVIISPDGKTERVLKPTVDGQAMKLNDLAFDSKWNIYFTDWRGCVGNELGGVFRYEASDDYQTLTPIIRGLCCPNGIGFSPDERVMWIGESSRNQVLRIALGPDGLLSKMASVAFPVYQNMGRPVPDSLKVDTEGYIYQGIQWGGRILILNPDGIPCANVLVPGREEGHLLMTPNLAIKPGTNEGYMVASGPEGSWIYKFPTVAVGA